MVQADAETPAFRSSADGGDSGGGCGSDGTGDGGAASSLKLQ